MKDASFLNPERWVGLYGDMLFRFALQRVGSIDTAEDLVQESLLAAMKAKERFHGHSSEKTWLFAILKHKIIDYFREKQQRKAEDLQTDQIPEADSFFDEKGNWRVQPGHWDENPLEVYEQKEFLDAFYSCLSKIPKRLADAFVYREIDGLDTEEICRRLNITADNCGVMLHRARMSLQGCIGMNYSNK